MAVTDKRGGLWRSRMHFLLRFVGLTAVAVMVVGAGWALRDDLLSWEATQHHLGLWQQSMAGESVAEDPSIAVLLLAGGLAAGLFALIVEVVIILRMVAGRRSAFGFNAIVQIVLAVVLLAGVNIYTAGSRVDLSCCNLGEWHTSSHYARIDMTRDGRFTLPESVLRPLAGLQGETTIIVYDRDQPFANVPDNQSPKDLAIQRAAEKVVVEKVKDLIDQFREHGSQYRSFGGKFRIEVLDVNDKDVEEKLGNLADELAEQMVTDDENVLDEDEKQEAIRVKAESLRQTIENAPENSIFFVSGDRVKRLSFNDFYYLDKKASRAEDNLVLLYQGAEPFARKIMNVDEKKPVIGLLVIHEWLTTKGPEEFGMKRAREVLEGQGFEVRDILLKKWSENAPPEPAVYTYDESRYEQLEEELNILKSDLKDLNDDLKTLTKLQGLWRESTLKELTKRYADQLDGSKVTEAMRARQLAVFDVNVEVREKALENGTKERARLEKEMSGLSVDRLAERRRMTDLKAKLDRELADCDLIVVPRMTLRNVTIGDRVANRVHHLDTAQVDAIRDYLKSGKPMLVCFGPTSEPAERFGAPPDKGPDGLERLMTELGFRFGNETVLFDAERKGFAERRSGLMASGFDVEVPPVQFDWHAGALAGTDKVAPRENVKKNPVHSSLVIALRSIGGKGVRLRHPRPITFNAEQASQYEPYFVVTDASSWNEKDPFPTSERTPQFDMPQPGKESTDAERRGPFPIGVAVETDLPESWKAPGKVRVAALGHGHLFVDRELSPASEAVLLTLSNWLLGQEDSLPRADKPWAYPRVGQAWGDAGLDAEARQAQSNLFAKTWVVMCCIGLPLLFAYIGLIVFNVRRLR